LHNKARFLQSWSDRSIDNIKMQLVVAKEVVLQLEKARDRRQLTTHEESLRQEFKMKSLGLSSFQRTIARQESRLLWLREGDAPSKFFHIHANHRRWKNFIHELEHEGQRITSEECKADVIFQFFHQVLGYPVNCTHSINLEPLSGPRQDLKALGCCFTEEEVWRVIKTLPPDKAPGRTDLLVISYRSHGMTSWQFFMPSGMQTRATSMC
jgi:hypothetical protein